MEVLWRAGSIEKGDEIFICAESVSAAMRERRGVAVRAGAAARTHRRRAGDP